MRITDDIIYAGVNDRKIEFFEAQYAVPRGMAYNSYVIKDEKTAVMDSVDGGFTDEWLSNIDEIMQGKAPDYLVVQHMEPDHSANIVNFLKKYPEAAVVANAKAFTMMDNFFREDMPQIKRVVVKNGETLSLGSHELKFIFAPMVHWPEVMFTYDMKDKVLFSADAFGKFGTTDTDEPWDDEARRYYIGIVGKYGAQVQNVLKAAAKLEINIICPLHGPVLSENLEHYIEKYDIWSSYRPETEGVMVAYTSVYGHTAKAAEMMADMLKERGCEVYLCNLGRTDMSEAVAQAFRYGKLVLATTTYNADIFPFMREFIEHLTERNIQNKTIGLIENGSWAPVAAKVMSELIQHCRSMDMLPQSVKILSSLSADNIKELEAMADALCSCGEKKEEEEKEPEKQEKKKKWVCKICGYVYEGDELPEGFTCPICRKGPEFFELQE